jgi:hypothetical protein
MKLKSTDDAPEQSTTPRIEKPDFPFPLWIYFLKVRIDRALVSTATFKTNIPRSMGSQIFQFAASSIRILATMAVLVMTILVHFWMLY